MAAEIKVTGNNFVILKQKARSRAGVIRLSRQLIGGAVRSPSFTLVYSRPEQFGGYLAKRLYISTRLARLAHYYVFLFRPAERLHVAGAYAQYGSGIAGAIERDAQGRVIYSGYDAAHVRLGTYYLGSEAVCKVWHRRLVRLLQPWGLSASVIAEILPVNGVLLNLMTMFEAMTDQTDALLNRVFGQLESELHSAMNNLLLYDISQDAAVFEQAICRFSDSLPGFLAEMLKRHARRRLVEIAQEPSREQLQSPNGPRMFASEGEMLRALVDELGQQNSATWRDVTHWKGLAQNDIRDELADVGLALQEIRDLSP